MNIQGSRDRIARALAEVAADLPFDPAGHAIIAPVPYQAFDRVQAVPLAIQPGPASIKNAAMALRTVSQRMADRVTVIGFGAGLEEKTALFAGALDAYAAGRSPKQEAVPGQWRHVHLAATISDDGIRFLYASGRWSAPHPMPAIERDLAIRRVDIYPSPTWEMPAPDRLRALRSMNSRDADQYARMAIDRLRKHGAGDAGALADLAVLSPMHALVLNGTACAATLDPEVGAALLTGYRTAPNAAREALAPFAALYAARSDLGPLAVDHIRQHVPAGSPGHFTCELARTYANGDPTARETFLNGIKNLERNLATQRRNLEPAPDRPTPPPPRPTR